MKYQGGKERIAGALAAVIQPFVDDCGAYCEPFLGGASVFARIRAREKYASDANPYLIDMWRAIARGWEPPEMLSEADYRALRAFKPRNNPLTAFAGFGCSYGGKWYGGYTRSRAVNSYAARARRGLSRKAHGFRHCWCVIDHCDYRRAYVPDRAVIYCDPPYSDCTRYAATGPFDTAAFWQWARNMSTSGHVVFTSEYEAPSDFEIVWSREVRVLIAGSEPGHVATEKLFRYNHG